MDFPKSRGRLDSQKSTMVGLLSPGTLGRSTYAELPSDAVHIRTSNWASGTGFGLILVVNRPSCIYGRFL